MTGYNDFMRLALGRQHELEHRLRESTEPRLAKIYRLIYGKAIEAPDLFMAESLASVLKTSIDDDYVVGIILDNCARSVNTELQHRYNRECKSLDRLAAGGALLCAILFVTVVYLNSEIKNGQAQTISMIGAVAKSCIR
ncbi:hypothetical protein [Methylobacterium sp. J-067]|uniref:hypothetical protein n=1 Tax=Methylobacterium sp. J-067 TaxID=2836648 RepID=UPI001FB9D33A|nr:hypothetical protein [Methylobacterium sp. J-067]MCJ2025286.1 hypothetical protein [Methylobacterium sp. J-067]